jgi:hypothetical protein
MDKYTDAYKKWYTEKLGIPVEQFDDIITSAKRPSAEHISKMNRMAKIAMEGGSMEELASLTPKEQFTANQMRNKMYFEKSLAEKIPEYAKVADSKLVVEKAPIAKRVNRVLSEAEKQTVMKLVPPTAEKYKAVLTEGEKRTAKNLLSGLSGNIEQAAPMETPYGKSFLSYTPEGKVAGKAGAALRGLGKVASKVAGPIGAALTAYDLGAALSEIQDKGAAKIAEDYKNSQSADASPTTQEYKKNPRMADAAPKNMELRGEEESPKAGVIMTPEVVKALEEKRQKLIETRRDLEKQRRMDEYDQRARARQMRVRDTLAETGLDGS